MNRRNAVCGVFVTLLAVVFAGLSAPVLAQRAVPRDPAEPQQGRSQPKVLARPAGAVARKDIDEKAMHGLIEQLVACGTRLSLSSWSDAKRGIGCGRDRIAARLNEIAKDSGGKLQVVVDKFDSTSERTSGKSLPLESVYAILPGTDPKLAKTVFIVSGHFDSRPSNVMDTEAEAPGADDDASGVAVSVESARLLSKTGATRKGYRATLLFAAISGEEQGLLGGYRLLEWAKQQGYTIGGMLDDDIVGDDPVPGAPHRVRLFSGNGEIDDCDSPGRELARAIEEIDGREAVRLIFRVDRYGRGGDHYPFYKAGLPAVRFTEPLEDSPSAELHTPQMYEAIRARLKPKGTYALQASMSGPHNFQLHAKMVTRLKDVFSAVYPYSAYVPAFDTEWGFALCGGTLNMQSDIAASSAQNYARSCGGLRFYDAETQRRLFNLPRYLRQAYESK